MKKMQILILFLGLTLLMPAPEYRTIAIIEFDGAIRPYERICDAVFKVESNLNANAVGDKHLRQWSYGIGQIRQERLNDYNKVTGNSYTVSDLFNPDVSRKIFLYYAHQFGPYRTDEMIKAWNGSGPLTVIYLKKVKKELTLLTP